MKLSDISPGQHGQISGFDKNCPVCRRLTDLGFYSGATVECLIKGISGTPIAYKIGGSTIALRKVDARKVGVRLWQNE